MSCENISTIDTLVNHSGGVFLYKDGDDLIDFYFKKYGNYVHTVGEQTRVLHAEQVNTFQNAFPQDVHFITHNGHDRHAFEWRDWLNPACRRAGYFEGRNSGYLSLRLELPPSHHFAKPRVVREGIEMLFPRLVRSDIPMFILIKESYAEHYLDSLRNCPEYVVSKLGL